MEIFLVRHAESEGNSAGLFTGKSDPDLSAGGQLQAEAVAARLARYGIDSVLATPFSRTRETALAIAQAVGCGVEEEAALREMDYGEWEGKSIGEIGPYSDLAEKFSDPLFSPPGGESVVEMYDRTRAALSRIVASSSERVVVVSHMGPIKAGAIWALSAGLDAFTRIRIDNASITRIRVSRSTRFLVALNDCGHLE